MERARAGALLLAIAGAGLAGHAAAQVTGNGAMPAAQASPPDVAATAVPVPAAPVIVLPTPAPRPTPTATRAPRAKPSPTPTPSASATPAPRASATPEATPSPLATPAPPPAAVATPQPATIEPTPTATASPAVVAAPQGGQAWWPYAVAAAALALLLAGWLVWRRREAHAPMEEEVEPRPIEEPLAAVPVEPVARPRLSLAFRPIRAGLNLLSATSENEIVVTNTGDAVAADVRLLVRLFSAHTGQDAELAAFYAQPIARPSVPAFALAPGEQRSVSIIAALPREAIHSLNAAGRPMFVPVAAVNIGYAYGDEAANASGQMAQAFAIGVERVDSPKLAPFWLDTPARSYDQVAARPHAAALER